MIMFIIILIVSSEYKRYLPLYIFETVYIIF